MRIEILCTGDEVLSGKTINTNYSHMARRLQEVGLDVVWGTTVGDDRESLVEAFKLAGARADAVIVNGGLGPTVDDLSQEVAAEAAGVGLKLDEGWLKHIETFYAARGRVMPPNNKKQAMLPEGSELIDNPVGTACGFALTIGKAKFYFTPGVPREIRHMLEHQLIPRLLAQSGTQAVVRLKRFHSFGMGESRVDDMLKGAEDLAEGGEVKLGFQAHYPQLETKLFGRGQSMEELETRMAPIEAAIRERMGAYILSEDTDTLESVILKAMAGGTLAVAEYGTNGAVAGRMVAIDSDGKVFKRGGVGGTIRALGRALGLGEAYDRATASTAKAYAEAVADTSSASHGLAVLIAPADEGNSGEGMVQIAVARSGQDTIVRSACIVGGPDRVRNGGVEMGLDGLRRILQGLSAADPVDFERKDAT
ncbi:MAG: CinA family nicotinamide mononucleotide deamidase-related protein [Alphaproteobacteria bacterium]|jgi:nicotinamide-nucleotide amidase|nr:CinA family nicotinamide mononucleotide deamidase-related protein [Alphaproteobacteria bacterium]